MSGVERVTLTPAEAAAMLGISPSKLREYKAARLIAWVPIGRGGVSYRPEDVIAFRDAMVRPAAPQVTPKRSTPSVATSEPEWRRRARLAGEINDLTGRPIGQSAS